MGQLGNASEVPSSWDEADQSIQVLEEAPVVGGHRFIQLAAGDYHACGLDDQYEAWCWG
jgi:hypothetical protein